MRAVVTFVTITATIFLLTACGGIDYEQQTLESRVNIQQTQLNNLRITATVEYERLLITSEHAETQVARVGTQQGLILSTLNARGVDISILPPAVTLPPTSVPVPTSPLNIDMNFTPSPTPPIITPRSAITTPTPQAVVVDPDSPLYLQDFTMSTGVGSDDCAVGITNQFNTQTPEIYVIARAVDIAAGTRISSQWFRDEEILSTFVFTPDFYIENNCIWFFADQTDFDFTPGIYSVRLQINELPTGPPIPFTIIQD